MLCVICINCIYYAIIITSSYINILCIEYVRIYVSIEIVNYRNMKNLCKNIVKLHLFE